METQGLQKNKEDPPKAKLVSFHSLEIKTLSLLYKVVVFSYSLQGLYKLSTCYS